MDATNSIEVKQKEDDIERKIQERKEKIKELLKKDKLLTLFLILALISLIHLIPGVSGVTRIFLDTQVWWILLITFSISAIFCYKNIKQFLFIPGIFLAVYISTFVRTRNLQGLKDITTNSWTLGPDLDPFLFLRYAKYIVEHGSLMVVDTMRYVPLGFKTAQESMLLPYMIAYTHKILSLFISNVTIEYSAVIFPVIMFALTIIAFFFLVRKIFEEHKHKDIIASLASLFLAVSPAILSRTIAGIPEKESAAFLFLFLAFYFYLYAFKSSDIKKSVIFGILAAVSTALMGLIWGGVLIIYFTLAISTFVAFAFNKIEKNQLISYGIWIIFSIAIILFFSERFILRGFISSPDTGGALGILAIMLLDKIWPRFSFFRNISDKMKSKYKLPPVLFSVVLSLILLAILVSITFGIKFVPSQVSNLIRSMISPVVSRHALTVAENRQPYFDEWRGSFGPVLNGFPLTFWLFFIGSAYLFYISIKHFEKKEKFYITSSYVFMISGIIFSRYAGGHTFDGGSTISRLFYFGSLALFVLIAGYFYWKNYFRGNDSFRRIDFVYLFLFSYFIISLIGARSAVRLIMILSPPVAILIGFFAVAIFNEKENKTKSMKYFYLILSILIVLLSFYSLYFNYLVTKNSASGFAPSSYTHQWQKAMQWVRENTDEDAVFTHWWDYGYWVQSIGNRATMLDGGNAIGYWNHLMGRHGLTGPDPKLALELFYAHNVTHFLIDFTDIGKYGAYANIGGDENLDRSSYLPTILLNTGATQEARNEMVYVYGGYQGSGIALDDDVITEQNGTREVFPAGSSGIGAIIVKVDKNTSQPKQPEAVFVSQGKQKNMPMRYLYYNNNLIDFNSGIESGLFVFPRIDQQDQSINIIPNGASIYLSKRTVNSMMARLFLFNQPIEGFSLVHVQSNAIVENLRAQGADTGEFVFFGDVQGPIKIWEINYPNDIKLNPEFLRTDFPIRELEF
ncbi:hypothetical protein HYV49_06265 [Candidatus Pacearchaeota archaeon]|nr:hypothetical protein [Candidatus Pacearchaeota archaeon]